MPNRSGPNRREPRLPANLPVRLLTIDPETDPGSGRPFFRSTRAWTGNLSRGGLFVHTREPLAPGRRVLVEIGLPDGAVEAVGRVAWARRVSTPEGHRDAESGVGLQLLGMAGEPSRCLERFLRDRPSRSRASRTRRRRTPADGPRHDEPHRA